MIKFFSNSKRRILGFLILILLCAAPTQAEVRRFCLVSYEKEIGYSDDVKVEVTFVTGKELNRATKSYNYNSFDNYALIWFSKDEVAILKIDAVIFGVGDEFTSEDFKNLFRIMGECNADQINARAPRKWKIKGKVFLQWVDPRADE